jgi:hypothetical protein
MTDRERHIAAWLCLAGVSAGGLAWVILATVRAWLA